MGEQMAERAQIARRLADESFRHSWDMSDERRINGAWVAGLCCECGDFVPFGQEVAHLAAAFAPLVGEAQVDEKSQVCGLVDRCCWDGTEDGPACWNVGACGCKVIAHSPASHPTTSPDSTTPPAQTATEETR